MVTVSLKPPFDFVRTMRTYAFGLHDPSCRVAETEMICAAHTPDGPVAVRVERDGDMVRVEAWGSGASFALARAEGLCGMNDDPSTFATTNTTVHTLHHRMPGIHIVRSPWPSAMHQRVILLQRIVSSDAMRSMRVMIDRFGEDAPGPHALRLPPSPDRMRTIAMATFFEMGIDRNRANALREAARVARALDRADSLETAERILGVARGSGPWTKGFVRGHALGDVDAAPTGDLHLPNAIAYALAGEERADDARMLELLEPFRGHRFRVIKLITAGAPGAPRRGPRPPLRVPGGPRVR